MMCSSSSSLIQEHTQTHINQRRQSGTCIYSGVITLVWVWVCECYTLYTSSLVWFIVCKSIWSCAAQPSCSSTEGVVNSESICVRVLVNVCVCVRVSSALPHIWMTDHALSFSLSLWGNILLNQTLPTPRWREHLLWTLAECITHTFQGGEKKKKNQNRKLCGSGSHRAITFPFRGQLWASLFTPGRL